MRPVVKHSGIYTTTINKASPAGFSTIGPIVADALNPEGKLREYETCIATALKYFGVIVALPPEPPPLKAPPGYKLTMIGAVPLTPRMIYRDPADNQINLDRAINLMIRLVQLRGAAASGLSIEQAVWCIELGRYIEQFNVTPHEPDAKHGRDDKAAKLRGGNRQARKLKDQAQKTYRLIREINRKIEQVNRKAIADGKYTQKQRYDAIRTAVRETYSDFQIRRALAQK